MAKRATAKRRRRHRVRYEDIAVEFHREVVVPRRVLIDSGYDLDHLRRHFRGCAITAIDEASIREYALTRQDQGAPDATINGEIRTLDRVLRFAVQTGKLRHVPMGEFPPEPSPSWFTAGGGPRPRGEDVSRGVAVSNSGALRKLLSPPARSETEVSGLPLDDLRRHLNAKPKDKDHPKRSIRWRADDLTKELKRPISIHMVKRGILDLTKPRQK